ncbi:uncharacterized protein LOC108658444 [Drosophila navojoa]|nr:uncharacterized protein LOC108658444 [Drosophila navojoa]
MLKLHKSRCEHLLITISLLIYAGNQLNVVSATTQMDWRPIPQLCDPIQCPADADMECPEDSAIREMREISAVNLLSSNAVGGGLGGAMETTERSVYNSSQVPDELFALCCLSKKCMCKTCYNIPGCNTDEGEVVVELQPEDMNTPGQCCGKYECKPEPNCSDVRNTNYYWLQSCQRCLCNSGARICQQSCDEGKNAICESKNLNMYFKDGDSWKDGCYQCECVKGEQKCVIPLCAHVNCPSERQVMIKDHCCPVCWPKGAPMPHEKPSNYDDGYGYEREEPAQPETDADVETDDDAEAEAETETELPVVPLADEIIVSSSTTTTSSTTSRPSVTPNAELIDFPRVDASAPPCQPADFPKVVEVVHRDSLPNNVKHVAIVVLTLVSLCEYLYIRRLLAKQRSYRPVSNFDDKV